MRVGVLVAMTLNVVSYCTKSPFVLMEKRTDENRHDFVRVDLISRRNLHKVVIAIQQNNLDILKDSLLDVSNPLSSNYGMYFTRAEIGLLTSNYHSTEVVLSHLNQSGVKVLNSTLYGEYITASAPIYLWERILNTKFYEFRSINSRHSVRRALSYSAPSHLVGHIYAIFNVVNLPPLIAPHSELKFIHATTSHQSSAFSGFMTPPSISSYYNIKSNMANGLATQSVYETSGQYYSTSDLLQFQSLFGYGNRKVNQNIGNHSLFTCSTVSSCSEVSAS